jgi:hypothetical protein
MALARSWLRDSLADWLEPFGGVPAVDAALDIEQGVEPLHRLQRDRIDHAGLLVAALPARRSGDVGQLEELAPRVGKAASFEHRAGLTAGGVQLAVAAIGIGLQDA